MSRIYSKENAISDFVLTIKSRIVLSNNININLDIIKRNLSVFLGLVFPGEIMGLSVGNGISY